MRLKTLFPSFNKSQQVGVVLLLFLIIVSQYVIYFVDFSSQKKIDMNKLEIIAFQKEIDSLKIVELEKRKPKVYPFNPSFITDYKGYKLGMSIAEIDRLLAHRKTGKYINSAKEFQKVTGISDSLFTAISPYFKFPDWVNNKDKKTYYPKSSTAISSNNKNNYIKKIDNFIGPKKDINSATAEDLRQIRGVGEKLSARILKYRSKLKGYMIDEQLYEVWYLDKEVADKILQRFTVLKKPQIVRININTAQFKEVLHAPYMDYDLTKKIFEYRDEMAEIQYLEELKKIEGFPLDKFDRISLYLTAE